VRLAAPFKPFGEHVALTLGEARVVFTTRRGGVSAGPYATLNLGLLTGDEPEAVHANRDRLARQVGAPWKRFARGRQVHGVAVRRVRALPAGELPEPADGQATALTGVPAIVLTADCLPIALASTGTVAMLHAGWRGLAGDLMAEGVKALGELGGLGPVRAAIGPGAGRCCYEVGEEVHAHFASVPGARAGARNLDLAAIAKAKLAEAGVAEVHDLGLCTMCRPGLFFSHRRDRGTTGRQAGVVWRA
jgi:polyphenol oxidase